MSTRGFVGIRLDGVLKGLYSAYDSYPSFLGQRLIEVIKSDLYPVRRQYKAICKNFKATKWITESEYEIIKPDNSLLFGYTKEHNKVWDEYPGTELVRISSQLGTNIIKRMETELFLSVALLPCILLPKALGLIHPDAVVREYFAGNRLLVDESDFTKNIDFCEWIYVLDLDSKEFVVTSYSHSSKDGGDVVRWPLFKLPNKGRELMPLCDYPRLDVL